MFGSISARRLGATIVTVAALAMTASPAHAAVSKADSAGDTKWTRSGTITAPSANEKNRIDIVNSTYSMSSTSVVLKVKVRNWVPAGGTGVPASSATTFQLGLYNTDLTRGVFVSSSRFGSQAPTSMLAWGTASGTGGSSCTTGQVKLGVSASLDTITLVAPRSCFPKGWRLTKAQASTGYAHSNSAGTRSGSDMTGTATSGFAAVNWVPRA